MKNLRSELRADLMADLDGCNTYAELTEVLDVYHVSDDGRKRILREWWGCQGHPAGPSDPMGVTVYCDGACLA